MAAPSRHVPTKLCTAEVVDLIFQDDSNEENVLESLFTNEEDNSEDNIVSIEPVISLCNEINYPISDDVIPDDHNDVSSSDDDQVKDPSYQPASFDSTSSESDEETALKLNPHKNVDIKRPEDQGPDTEVEQERGRSRKRKRNIDSWKSNIRKTNRARGEEYITRKGKIVPSKVFNYDFDCRMKCTERIPNAEVTRIHLALADKITQHRIIHSLTHKVPVKQRCSLLGDGKVTKTPNKSENDDGLRHSYQYNVKLLDGTSKRVCQRHFCEIYCTTQKELVWLHKFEGTPPSDKRKGRKSATKTDETVIKLIEEHIKSFPPMSSHYSRRENPNKRFLNPKLGSVRNMWLLFLEKHEARKAQLVKEGAAYSGIYKEWLYRHIFSYNFNLGIGLPRSDTCAECGRYNISIQNAEFMSDNVSANNFRQQWDTHIQIGDAGYRARKEDLDQACSSWKPLSQYSTHPQPPCSLDATDLYIFDYKKNFLIPNLNHNDIYYQRQLCIYLLGVQDCVKSKSLMYYYPETKAKKGGSEVSSMVYDAVKRQQTGAKRCIFYTDGCGGQNRNRDVMTMMQKLTDDETDKSFEQIDHKILLRGHTRLPNDADFAHIEKLEGRREVHLPEEYGQLIAESVRERGRFTPIPVNLLLLVSSSSNFASERIKEKQLVKVPVAKRGSDVSGVLVNKYTTVQLPIKKAKWDDLKKISNFLPLQKREFYKSLTHIEAKATEDE